MFVFLFSVPGSQVWPGYSTGFINEPGHEKENPETFIPPRVVLNLADIGVFFLVALTMFILIGWESIVLIC